MMIIVKKTKIMAAGKGSEEQISIVLHIETSTCIAEVIVLWRRDAWKCVCELETYYER